MLKIGKLRQTFSAEEFGGSAVSEKHPVSCVPDAHTRIKIRKRAGDGISGAGISLMQTIIIKSNRLRDSVRRYYLGGFQ